jgi:hypothetical protein
MSTKRGAYSGSGKSPLADKNCLEDRKQDSGAQRQPKADKDYAGGLTGKFKDMTDKFVVK